MTVRNSTESLIGSHPECYLAYAPQGPGLECALTYFVREADVYGWWIGLRDLSYPAAYFKLERFFSSGVTAFLATDHSDLYGGWRYDFNRREPALDKSIRVEDELCHKLARLQDAFANEWLWFRDADPRPEEERYYREAELAVQAVNAQSRMLGKFDKTDAVWTFESHGLNIDIVACLCAHWPLEYGRPER